MKERVLRDRDRTPLREEVDGMANEEHLERLGAGIEIWNNWRRAHPEVRANLFRADLKGRDLSRANLRHVDLRRANLAEATLRASDLSESYLIGANLHGCDLTGATLRGALLREVDLSDANLSEADLSEAYLSEADLSRSKILHTKLDRTRLTGACVEDWSLDRPACLDFAICEYVYLKQNRQDCRPRLGSFAPGELTQLFQKMYATIELMFSKGIEWASLLEAIETVRSQKNLENLAIFGLEESENGSLLVQLKIPPQSDKLDVKKLVMDAYATAVRKIDLQYQTERPEIDRRDIELYRNRNASILDIIKFLASRSI
ncbi:pentapeptide repeat-containing protein [Baaleninema simplex]|uniref:pentapeptide repeat-containing protein n=1 Tax=Baaleninema simplex TaxID=2862350 RepID=UPI0003466B8C|nr:pentapeptide repeat-containing protein [Baaleninema simplex]